MKAFKTWEMAETYVKEYDLGINLILSTMDDVCA